MTATTGDRLLADYLARLDAAALRLPPDRRVELMEGIAEHVAAARAAGELPDEAAVRTLLDRLGEPEEIVAAAVDDAYDGQVPYGGRAPHLVPHRPGTGLELAAVLMLTVGSLLPVLGWLVGVALLWSSKRWRTAEKLLGTLVVPFGPALVLPLTLLRLGPTCTTSFSGTVGGGSGGAVLEPLQPLVPGAPSQTGPPDVSFTPPPDGAATTVCEGGLPLPEWFALALAVVALVGPFVVAVVLLRRARARAQAEPPVMLPAGGRTWTGLEIAAIVLLGAGTFILPVVGPIVGLVLAWASDRWTTAEKAVATALVVLPIVLLVAFWVTAFLGVAVGFFPLGGPLLLLAVFLGFGPLLAAGYLALALSRR